MLPASITEHASLYTLPHPPHGPPYVATKPRRLRLANEYERREAAETDAALTVATRCLRDRRYRPDKPADVDKVIAGEAAVVRTLHGNNGMMYGRPVARNSHANRRHKRGGVLTTRTKVKTEKVKKGGAD